MPDRTRARVLLTALLLVLTVAGIRAIGPPGDWGGHATNAVLVGLASEVALAGLYAALRWRHTPQGAFATRINKLVSAVVALAWVGIAVGIVFFGFSQLPENAAPHQPARLPRIKIRLHAHPFRSSGFDISLVRTVIVAIVIIAIAVVLVLLWRRRRQALMLSEVAEFTVDEAESELARAVESGRAALRELDDARAAIIRCYVAMEQSLREAGTERAVAETPDELLGRAVQADLVPPAPAEQLTRLFYEARFSSHHMPRSQRDEAELALADIAAVLPVGEPA